MSQYQSSQMPQEKFLRISVNLLYQAFIDAGRTEAKALFRELAEGKRTALTNVIMEDGGKLRFDLSLTQEQFRGSLNFSTFKRGLTELLVRADKALNNSEKLTVFSGKEDRNQMIFGVLGTTVDGDQVNVLALGADSNSAGAVELRLMYLDHSQFDRSAVAGAPESEQPESGQA